MSTSLANCRILLSKELGDFWASTTTSAGASTYDTLVDTALKAKPPDWITDNTFTLITKASDSSEDDERKVKTLDDGTGALATLPHTAQIGSSITYELHRLFTASDKRLAIIHAAQTSFPDLFERVLDESKVSGNWLKDGSFEIWTSDTALTHWTDDGTVILTKTSASPYVKHGKYSCKLSTAAGYIHQDITNWDDLKYLAGKTVTFTLQGHCDKPSCLRLAIYDGTTTTYSSYHDGDSAQTDDPLEVTATIADNPTDIEFRVYQAVAAGTSYIDDGRVMSGHLKRIYIGDLNLAQNKPHQIFIEPSDYSNSPNWILINDNVEYDQTNGYLYLNVRNDYRLRIVGIKYLDFVDSSGDSSTAWDSTIALDSPQIEILVAKAIIYLCHQMVTPDFSSATSEKWERALAYWDNELRSRIARFGMYPPPATLRWR